MDVPPGVLLIGFAVDLAVVGTAYTGQFLENLVNTTLRRIDDWLTNYGLELAHDKTDSVILTRRRAYVPSEAINRRTANSPVWQDQIPRGDPRQEVQICG